MVGYPFDVYDCFTDTRFGGNVGGIVWDAADLTPEQMQGIARELNAPVTGFVTARDGREVTARFFMPGGEIAMCGHVTIGMFTHLAGDGGGGDQTFTLKAGAGDVPVRVVPGPGGPQVMMELAVPQAISVEVDEGALLAALGAGDAPLVAAPGAADAGLRHLFVAFGAAGDVAALVPDFAALRALSEAVGVHTVGCFAMTGEGALVIRDFCPAVGVNETPASGTTNGALSGYLVARGLIAPEIRRIVARQGREIGRPSVILSEIVIEGGAIAGLQVGGQAVPSLSGRVAAL